MVELAAKLTNDFRSGHAALATDNGQKGSRFFKANFLIFIALICFGNKTPWNYCDKFVLAWGSTNVASSTFESRYSHRQGGLGNFNGHPTSVGSYVEDGYRKVEQLREDGWYSLPDHPE
jgi:hypothetical protein